MLVFEFRDYDRMLRLFRQSILVPERAVKRAATMQPLELFSITRKRLRLCPPIRAEPVIA
jgi:hypothetical protein